MQITRRDLIKLGTFTLVGCGSSETTLLLDNRPKLFIEFGDSTTNQRGNLVQEIANKNKYLIDYINRGYDGRTTYQTVQGWYGDNSNSGVTFQEEIYLISTINQRRIRDKLPEYRIIVGINLGINDKLQGLPTQETKDNISKLISTILNNKLEVLLILPNHLLYDFGMKDYTEYLKTLGLPFVDVFSIPTNLPDGIHPDEDSRNRISSVITEAIYKL